MDKSARYEAQRDVVHTVNCGYRDISRINPHFHQSIEITYLIKGQVDFHIGANCFRMSEGQISFVPGYFAHYTDRQDETNDKTNAAVLIIPKKCCDEFYRETGNESYFLLDDAEKNKRIGKLMTELADGIDGMNELLIKAYVNMILGLIRQNYAPVCLNNANNDLMLQIIEYIDAHYSEKLTLSSLSDRFGYSKYYFSRLFNKTFNCNLNAYVNSVRARAVNEKKGEGKITELIIESGFNTLSSYYRTIK